MKKIIRVLVIAIVSLLSFNASAQFGVKGGLGISSLLSKNNDVNISAELYNAGLSFHTGVSYEIDLGDMVSIEPAFLYSRKTYSIQLENLFKVKLDYLEIPINTKVYALELGDVGRLYGLGGIYMGFLVSGKVDTEPLRIGNKSTDNIKPLDGGFNIGAGVQFFDALNVDFSAAIGIANLSNNQQNAYRDKTRVIRLTVTYQFGE